MKITVFHGSPQKRNTYYATKIFMDNLSQHGDVQYTEFFMAEAIPAFCTGCTLCLSGMREKCPNAQYVTPILDAILKADALIFAAPHYGACDMPGGMKNLLDHLDFLVLNVSPQSELFHKKAIVITTGAGSTSTASTIKKFLKHCGINRIYLLGFKLFMDKWDRMPKSRQKRFEKMIQRKAKYFYNAPKKRPYLSTIFFYHMSKFILKKYVGKGNYPYEYWKEKGFFEKRPF